MSKGTLFELKCNFIHDCKLPYNSYKLVSEAIILNHTISGGGLGTLCKTKEGSIALMPVYVTCAKSLS